MDADRELGELRARVEALGDSFVDFRSETRAALLRIEQAVGPEGAISRRLEAHSRRLGVLERWRSGLAWAMTLVWAVVGMFVAWSKR